MEKEQQPVVALDFLGVGKDVSEIQHEKHPSEERTAASIPTSAASCLENRNFPPIALSLKTRESSAMSLKRIFDQISSSAGYSVQPIDSQSNTLQLLERKDQDVKCGWHLRFQGQTSSVDKAVPEFSPAKAPGEILPKDTPLLHGQTRAISSHWKPFVNRDRDVLSVRHFTETLVDEDRKADGGGSSAELPGSFQLTVSPAAIPCEEPPLNNADSSFGFPVPEGKANSLQRYGETVFGLRITKSSTAAHQTISSQTAHGSMLPLQELHSQPTSMGLPSRTNRTAGNQLTIFYAGMVNVYDDVPSDKAHAIMLLAGRGSAQVTNNTPNGNSIGSSQPKPFTASTPNATTNTMTRAVVPSVLSNSISNVSSALCFGSKSMGAITSIGAITSTSISTEICKHPPPGRSHTDLPVARKASLARFLEKRKDRVQSKVCLNEMKNENGNETVNRQDDDTPLGKQSSPKKMCSRSQSPSPTAAPNLPPQSPSPTNCVVSAGDGGVSNSRVGHSGESDLIKHTALHH